MRVKKNAYLTPCVTVVKTGKPALAKLIIGSIFAWRAALKLDGSTKSKLS
jgi:hypothetical protein